MHDQPRSEPYETSRFFVDGRADRPEPEGTIARGDLDTPALLRSGREGKTLVAKNPLTVDAELLARGKERYEIYCVVCHDAVGTGKGLAVLRGFVPPPSLHLPRLVDAPDGYIFDVITRGYGRMYSYRASVRPRDRWAIVAYVRALQLSQNVDLADIPAAERQKLEAQP